MSKSTRVWFITGAGSGFGKIVAELALQQGDYVVATSRTGQNLVPLQSKFPSEKLLTRRLDVSDAQEIKDGFAAAKEKFGRIDVVFNNAGFAVAGELEGIPLEAARKVFEVDFWGAAQVSLEAIKFFREVNGPEIGGRLLVVGSLMSIISSPAIGYYVSAKHALQGFHEGLASELDPEWNVKMTIVLPGMFRTGSISGTKIYPVHPAYNKPTLQSQLVRNLMATPDVGGDPVKASQKIIKLATLPEPPKILVLGHDALDAIQAHVTTLSEVLENSRSWSDDLA